MWVKEKARERVPPGRHDLDSRNAGLSYEGDVKRPTRAEFVNASRRQEWLLAQDSAVSFCTLTTRGQPVGRFVIISPA
jgi:hypothetical protein